MSKSMGEISFEEAMIFLDSCLHNDKKTMNKSFREFFAKEYGLQFSVKDAGFYINSYREINSACYDLAINNWESSEKPDYDQVIFSKYPSVNETLKSKWIQNANFRIFR